jgi:VIT1/CCC1 family predicted Fe2+/Mn2+ transporter
MQHSIKKGFSFGLTSGIITTLGLIVGLNSSTHSTKIVVSGILVIAIADALSDAFGMHISEEAENVHSTKQIWAATVATFLAKFIFALTFIVPILLFNLSTAIIISVLWGLGLIVFFSYYLSDQKKYRVVCEHLLIAIVVILITNFVGKIIDKLI